MRILRLFVKATGVWTYSQFRASSTDCREAASYSFPSEGTNPGWRATVCSQPETPVPSENIIAVD